MRHKDSNTQDRHKSLLNFLIAELKQFETLNFYWWAQETTRTELCSLPSLLCVHVLNYCNAFRFKMHFRNHIFKQGCSYVVLSNSDMLNMYNFPLLHLCSYRVFEFIVPSFHYIQLIELLQLKYQKQRPQKLKVSCFWKTFSYVFISWFIIDSVRIAKSRAPLIKFYVV